MITTLGLPLAAAALRPGGFFATILPAGLLLA